MTTQLFTSKLSDNPDHLRLWDGKLQQVSLLIQVLLNSAVLKEIYKKCPDTDHTEISLMRPSGQCVGLAIRWSRVRVPLWPFAGFVFG